MLSLFPGFEMKAENIYFNSTTTIKIFIQTFDLS